MTRMKRIKLEPCPFCGNVPSIKHIPNFGPWGDDGPDIVECDSFDCRMRLSTKPKMRPEEAILDWNENVRMLKGGAK